MIDPFYWWVVEGGFTRNRLFYRASIKGLLPPKTAPKSVTVFGWGFTVFGWGFTVFGWAIHTVTRVHTLFLNLGNDTDQSSMPIFNLRCPSSIISHNTTTNDEMNIAQMTDQDLLICERFGEFMNAGETERDRRFSSTERVVLENLGRPDCELKEESRTLWNGLYIARIDAEGDEDAGKF